MYLLRGWSLLELECIGPFVSIATNPDIITQQKVLSWTYEKLGFSNEAKFVAFTGLFIVILFCVKSVVSWCVQTYIFKFSYVQRKKLIQKLLSAYLSAPYTFCINKNSSEIIKKVEGLSGQFANSVLSTLLISGANMITILGISMMLCLLNPLAVLSIILVTLPVFFLFNYFKDKMYIWGKEFYESSKTIHQTIYNALGGLKETRVIGCNSFFEQECEKQAQRYADASIAFYGFKLVPRFLVETVLVTFLVGFTSISLLLNRDIQQLTSNLSVFGLAAIRLIPAITNLTGGLTTLRSSSHSLNELYVDLKEVEKLGQEASQVLEQYHQKDWRDKRNLDSSLQSAPSKIQLKEEIVLDNITYRYPNVSEDVLKGISLKIRKGESIALIGKSGAGKTTLVDVILGLLVPQGGDIRVDGWSIYNNLRSWQDLIGYIPQSIFLTDDTLEKNIAFGISDHLIDETRLNEAIKAAQLTEVVENLPKGTKTRIGEGGVFLSGGQRQRVGIARALYHTRDILVLDEATSALDNETENLVTEAIKSLSGIKTMIIIAHRLTTVEHCNQVYMIEKGKIVQVGSYEEVVLGKSEKS